MTGQTPSADLFAGLDLGQLQDYTALAVIRRVERRGAPQKPEADGRPEAQVYSSHGRSEARKMGLRPVPSGTDRPRHYVYQVAHLERFDLGTPYPAIRKRVRALWKKMSTRGASRTLVLDETGVGVSVADEFQWSGIEPVRIWIHGGEKVTREGRRYRVPKRELAGALQMGLSKGRLQVQAELPHAETLRREMQSFKAKINPATGHETYAADWREGDHDDLVLAVAMALWFAKRGDAKPNSASTPMHRKSDRALQRFRRRYRGR